MNLNLFYLPFLFYNGFISNAQYEKSKTIARGKELELKTAI